MRILLVSTTAMAIGDKYGGIEGLLVTFARGLLRAGHDVTIGAPAGSVVPDGAKLVETVTLPQGQNDDRRAEAILSTHGPFDIIHDFSHQHVFRERPNAIHMMWDPISVRYTFKSKQNIVCLSEWQKARFEDGYNQRCIIMPMCVDTDVYMPIEGAVKKRFLFLGKISADKGVHLAIQYAKDLDVPLDVVGGLVDSEIGNPYHQQIEGACDGVKIRFHFNVTEAEKVAFLQDARAMIYPVQMIEAHWLTGIEAWCCGLPTITFGTSSKPEILPDSTLAAANESEFKKKMLLKFDDAQIADHAVERYSMKNVVPQFLKIYRQVIDGRRW